MSSIKVKNNGAPPLQKLSPAMVRALIRIYEMTKNTMIERVARAICEEDERNGGAPWGYYEAVTHIRLEAYRDMARAAIAAMREPTPEIEKAGWIEGACLTPADHWKSMIDAALKE